MAVRDACVQIKERLAPIYALMGKDTPFPKIVQAAYFDRIDLSAHGYYATPNIGFDFQLGKGRPFHYFAYGGGCSEIEMDVLTGDFVVKRTDIVFDVGRSLNGAIDIGQVIFIFISFISFDLF